MAVHPCARFTTNVPKPRNSTRSRLTNAASISSKMALTALFTSLLKKCGFCAGMLRSRSPLFQGSLAPKPFTMAVDGLRESLT